MKEVVLWCLFDWHVGGGVSLNSGLAGIVLLPDVGCVIHCRVKTEPNPNLRVNYSSTVFNIFCDNIWLCNYYLCKMLLVKKTPRFFCERTSLTPLKWSDYWTVIFMNKLLQYWYFYHNRYYNQRRVIFICKEMRVHFVFLYVHLLLLKWLKSKCFDFLISYTIFDNLECFRYMNSVRPKS